jgi:Asp/Glu/hydantoin racemase
MARIALIHAVEAAIKPVQAAFKELWPEAKTTNLMDDSLSSDREAAGDLTPALSNRIIALADYVASAGADGILYTCSAFGPAIDAAARKLPIPVLKPNEAMFNNALDIGGRVGMLATFAPAVASMEQEFQELVRERQAKATLETYCVPGARDALAAKDMERHDQLIAEGASKLLKCSVIMLAHFSMATAAPEVIKLSPVPILTAPSAAINKLRLRLRG